MIKLIFLTTAGQKIETHSAVGRTIMQAATAACIPGVIGECGGGCSCGTCHVKFTPDWASTLATSQAPSALESEILEFSEGYCAASSRLGCQVKITEQMDGMVVSVAGD